MSQLKKVNVGVVRDSITSILPSLCNLQEGKVFRTYHKEDIKQKRALYRAKNREAINLQKRIYGIKHKEKIKMQRRNHYLKYKEDINLRQREYYLKNKHLFLGTTKHYTGEQKEMVQEQQRWYRLLNKEIIKDQLVQYREENKEALKEQKRIYYASNKEKIKALQKVYRLHHKQQIKDQQKQYWLKNKESIKEKWRSYYQKQKAIINQKYLPTKGKIPRPLKMMHHLVYFMARVSNMLRAKEVMDWYRISRYQVYHVGGRGIFAVFGNLGKALELWSPEVKWEMAKFAERRKKSTQRWLRVMLEEILPENTIIFEDFLHPDLLWDQNANHKMELDIWVPQYSLALEYQGEQHYYDHCVYGSLESHTKRDAKKKQACQDNGINLIIIPYWWDKTKASLSSQLLQYCPNLIDRPATIKILARPAKWAMTP